MPACVCVSVCVSDMWQCKQNTDAGIKDRKQPAVETLSTSAQQHTHTLLAVYVSLSCSLFVNGAINLEICMQK